MHSFYIYNTLTRKKEKFKPINISKISMYVCGITPYSDSHLGHARCYIVFDTLKRFLEHLGYNVFYIQNVTDIDDKILNKSKESGKTPEEIAEEYFKSFQENMKLLNVRQADLYPRVSGSIKSIIDFVEGLVSKGKAYENNGSVYFRVLECKDYGRLSGRNPDELISKQEVSQDEKEDYRDFAVWKADLEFGWDSPWGKGRPGWHIECSAMAKEYLGEEFDIHGGGLDLIFPHHENEMAQSVALTGKEPVKYWVHNGMVTLKGDKMAKSTGNYFLLKELLEDHTPMVVRMYILSSGYRQTIDFSIKSLKDIRKAYGKLVEFKKELKKNNAVEANKKELFSGLKEVLDALCDDLNTAKAIGELFKQITPIKEKIFKGSYSPEDIILGKKLISVFEDVLGIEILDENEGEAVDVESLIEKRNNARENKDFALADKIREELSKKGIELKDTPTGTRWIKTHKP